MADQDKPVSGQSTADAIEAESLRKAEKFIEQDEGATNRLIGWAGTIVTIIAVAMSLFHLYAAYEIVPTQELRYTHVAFVLLLAFLLFPMAARFRDRIRWWDVIAGLTCVGILIYAIMGGDDFTDRATTPNRTDVTLGVIFIVLLIEATRRTIGWIVPFIALLFIAYAMAGPWLPPPWNHRGYGLDALVGHLFITLEGIFGVPVDVSATLIVLFTIFGAFLQQSGAGKFFIDFSMTMMGSKPNAAGRTVVLSSFLLGGPSGSGVATTVTIGAVAYPMMKKAGFEKNAAGGLLSAGGLGAIISPPVLGAAAFLIAEFLKISYLDVIWMATIPTILYYLSLFFMVELDAKRYGVRGEPYIAEQTLGASDAQILVPLRLAVLHRHFHAVGLFADHVGIVRYRHGVSDELPDARDGDDAEKARDRAEGRLDPDADGGHNLRHRRHHRWRGDADRTGSEILLDRNRLRRRQPAPHRDLYRADRLDHRARGAGHRLLHHLRGNRGSRHDQARRARCRGAHVHLLLFGAVGSLAADRLVAVRSRRDHRRRPLQDHLAGVEIHAPGFPCSIRVRARSARVLGC